MGDDIKAVSWVEEILIRGKEPAENATGEHGLVIQQAIMRIGVRTTFGGQSTKTTLAPEVIDKAKVNKTIALAEPIVMVTELNAKVESLTDQVKQLNAERDELLRRIEAQQDQDEKGS